MPEGWNLADIGGPARSGGAAYDDTTFAVAAAGTDVAGTSDQFTYVYALVNGDADVIARVSDVDDVNAWSKAGLMVRQSLAANAGQVSIFATSSHGLALRHRPSAGATTSQASVGGESPPIWLKLERRGSTTTAFRSNDGEQWTAIGS